MWFEGLEVTELRIKKFGFGPGLGQAQVDGEVVPRWLRRRDGEYRIAWTEISCTSLLQTRSFRKCGTFIHLQVSNPCHGPTYVLRNADRPSLYRG